MPRGQPTLTGKATATRARQTRSSKDPNAYVIRLCKGNPNLLVPHFLIHSYLYYVMDSPIVTDATFDFMVKELGLRWEEVSHPHKTLIDRDMLKTGFYLEYPGIVAGAARSMAERFSC